MMEEKELILQLVKYYAPKTYDDAAFMQYLSERIDSYFDYFFFRGMEETIKWKVDDCLQSARDDYVFMSDPSHPVSLVPEEKVMRFGKYTVPVYWYNDGMPKRDIDATFLRYKRIWEKTGYGEMVYPLLQDWYPLELWREEYSEPSLSGMEKDLESGTTKEAMKLYYLYSRRAGLREIDRAYPNKIKQIISISNNSGTGKERTADLHLLLYDGRECSVQVGTDSQGRICSTTALTALGFPLFTDQDEELIQQALSDD